MAENTEPEGVTRATRPAGRGARSGGAPRPPQLPPGPPGSRREPLTQRTRALTQSAPLAQIPPRLLARIPPRPLALLILDGCTDRRAGGRPNVQPRRAGALGAGVGESGVGGGVG